jgi:hypothetical protein
MEQSALVRSLGVAVPAGVVILLIWAVFVVPGGAPWTGVAWFGALAALVVGTATLLTGLARTPAAAPVGPRRGPGG